MQLTYNFVVKKFEELKGFVQNCENAIDSTQNDYFNKKKRLRIVGTLKQTE